MESEKMKNEIQKRDYINETCIQWEASSPTEYLAEFIECV